MPPFAATAGMIWTREGTRVESLAPGRRAAP